MKAALVTVLLAAFVAAAPIAEPDSSARDLSKREDQAEADPSNPDSVFTFFGKYYGKREAAPEEHAEADPANPDSVFTFFGKYYGKREEAKREAAAAEADPSNPDSVFTFFGKYYGKRDAE